MKTTFRGSSLDRSWINVRAISSKFQGLENLRCSHRITIAVRASRTSRKAASDLLTSVALSAAVYTTARSILSPTAGTAARNFAGEKPSVPNSVTTVGPYLVPVEDTFDCLSEF